MVTVAWPTPMILNWAAWLLFLPAAEATTLKFPFLPFSDLAEKKTFCLSLVSLVFLTSLFL